MVRGRAPRPESLQSEVVDEPFLSDTLTSLRCHFSRCRSWLLRRHVKLPKQNPELVSTQLSQADWLRAVFESTAEAEEPELPIQPLQSLRVNPKRRNKLRSDGALVLGSGEPEIGSLPGINVEVPLQQGYCCLCVHVLFVQDKPNVLLVGAAGPRFPGPAVRISASVGTVGSGRLAAGHMRQSDLGRGGGGRGRGQKGRKGGDGNTALMPLPSTLPLIIVMACLLSLRLISEALLADASGDCRGGGGSGGGRDRGSGGGRGSGRDRDTGRGRGSGRDSSSDSGRNWKSRIRQSVRNEIRQARVRLEELVDLTACVFVINGT
mmetsp:Transcript_30746/g.55955  ORF Transcript_30746/g.55955 Transcript_30746/m.55955 type:complete len:321 (+) Transcript_30746:211-1173(+)